MDALHAEETRVVIADDSRLIEFDIESSSKKQNKGNIYLAKVTRVEPSLQAAFVEYGSGRQGFLPFSEIHPDYYQIPLADKQELLRAQAEQRAAEQAKIDEEMERTAKPSDDNDSESFENTVETLNDENAPASEISEKVDGEQVSLSENGDSVISPEQAEYNDQQEQQSLEDSHAEENAIAKSEAGVEDLGSDEPFERENKRPSFKRYKIQEVIKKNQVVLIQVIKEERGNKGASVTSYLSLPGRCCVLMPNTNKGGGVSRKINDIKERRKLKEIIESLEVVDGMSVIVRTAGMGKTKADIQRDYSYLIKLWNKIRETTLSSTAPALVYEEGSVLKRSLRDFYSNDVEDIVIAGDKAYEDAVEFMKMIMPTHIEKIIHHKDAIPVFNKYGVEPQLVSMYDPTVPMQSGGYIVINTTEALISIDVNSGRSTGERNVEDTATRTNIDAAYEIARQLRLRDLAGLIVIDFIDMMDSRHRRQVERALKDALKADRAKIQVGRISPFGLLEMSRQRLRASLLEINMIECPTCKAAGIIRSSDSSMVHLARSIENEVALAEEDGLEVTKVIVTTSNSLALHFLNQKRKWISDLEEEFSIQIVVESEDMSIASFKIQLEDANGNKTRLVSSEDREVGKLPQSREGKGRKPKRDRRPAKNKDIVRPVVVDSQPQEGSRQSQDSFQENDFADSGDSYESDSKRPQDGSNIEEVGDDNYRENGRNGNRNNRGRGGRYDNRNKKGGRNNNFRDRREGGNNRPPRDNANPQPQQGEGSPASAPVAAASAEPKSHSKPKSVSVAPEQKSFTANKTTRSYSPEPKAPKVQYQNQQSAVVKEERKVSSESEAQPKDTKKGWWRKIIE